MISYINCEMCPHCHVQPAVSMVVHVCPWAWQPRPLTTEWAELDWDHGQRATYRSSALRTLCNTAKKNIEHAAIKTGWSTSFQRGPFFVKQLLNPFGKRTTLQSGACCPGGQYRALGWACCPGRQHQDYYFVSYLNSLRPRDAYMRQ